MDLLEASPETYARALADASIVGLNNYSSQVVQILTDDEFATVTALIAEMTPEAHDELLKRVPNAAGVRIIRRSSFDESAVRELLETKLEPLLPRLEAQINDDDPVLQAVRRLVQDDKWGGVILQVVPGTGKSWYAREIAIKLVDGDTRRMREIQFHPSYQYEDFIEGYVPRGSTGFELRDKHLLEMAAIARTTDGPVVLIIDEFSRTDPARVMGESLTYMEGSLREIEFRLPSGRKVSIPSNLILLATMNPEDRSVDEIDAAMDRRWAKVDLKPDAAKLRAFLELNGLQGEFIGPVLIFFSSVQEYIEIGHAFFRNVRDVSSLKRLWEHQLKHTVRKRFRFDPESLNAVLALWDECVHALTSIGNQSDDQ
jgi:5-methylcytosine-specific restriction protein B